MFFRLLMLLPRFVFVVVHLILSLPLHQHYSQSRLFFPPPSCIFAGGKTCFFFSSSPFRQPLHLFETGNILLYLAERSGKFLPSDQAAKAECLNWLFFNVGPVCCVAYLALVLPSIAGVVLFCFVLFCWWQVAGVGGDSRGDGFPVVFSRGPCWMFAIRRRRFQFFGLSL